MSDRIALVTGAGSGIGRVVAKALGGDGFTVVLAGRNVQTLEETSASVARCSVVPCDVADEASVGSLFDTIRTLFGRLDFVFNNAGVSLGAAPLEKIDIADWRRTYDANVTGTFLCLRGAMGLMKAQHPQGGRIMNNGSVSAQVPRPHGAAYASSKHAVTGLTRTAAIEGRAFNIAVGQIDIGNTATSMAASMPSGVRQATGEVVAEPVFDVRHVASTILHIANLPLDVNVPFITLIATSMPLMGRG